MLFEFHRVQNAKKPGTIHATYLIGGTKRKEGLTEIEAQKDGEDDYMQSSPFVGSSMPQVEGGTGEGSTLSITLTREEDLESWNPALGKPYFVANNLQQDGLSSSIFPQYTSIV